VAELAAVPSIIEVAGKDTKRRFVKFFVREFEIPIRANRICELHVSFVAGVINAKLVTALCD